MHVVQWNAILAPEIFFPLKLENLANTTAACSNPAMGEVKGILKIIKKIRNYFYFFR
jgi:hypothetical protein